MAQSCLILAVSCSCSKRGHVLAQDKLGMKYFYGHGVAQDSKQAYIWCGVAALSGDEMAFVHKYFIGKLLSKDELKQAQAEINKCYKQFNRK